jgi:hypothetical protein
MIVGISHVKVYVFAQRSIVLVNTDAYKPTLVKIVPQIIALLDMLVLAPPHLLFAECWKPPRPHKRINVAQEEFIT